MHLLCCPPGLSRCLLRHRLCPHLRSPLHRYRHLRYPCRSHSPYRRIPRLPLRRSRSQSPPPFRSQIQSRSLLPPRSQSQSRPPYQSQIQSRSPLPPRSHRQSRFPYRSRIRFRSPLPPRSYRQSHPLYRSCQCPYCLPGRSTNHFLRTVHYFLRFLNHPTVLPGLCCPMFPCLVRPASLPQPA